jgi:hypothetical protein
MGVLDPDAGDVVQYRVRWAHTKSDVEKNVARAHLRAEPALLVDDDSNALVARPRQTEAIGLRADTATHFRDRHSVVVKPYDCSTKPGRNAWRGRRHPRIVAGTYARHCVESVTSPSQVTLCCLAWFRTRVLPGTRWCG